MNLSLESINSWVRRRGQTQAQVPDLNLIPPEYLGRRKLSRNNGLALLIVMELLIIITMFQTYGSASLSKIQELLGSEEGLSVEQAAAERRARLVDNKRATLNSLKAAQSEIDNKRINWPQLLDLYFNQTPKGVSVDSFQQNGSEVSLLGVGPSETEVFEFRDILRNSAFVSDVTIPSLTADAGGGVAFQFKLSLLLGVAVE